jgi:hypothetical protein
VPASRRSFAALAAMTATAALVLLPVLPASADQAECDVFGGTWDGPTTTCTISTAQTIAAGSLTGNLVIAAGGSLTR